MARIADEELERLKAETSVQRLVEGRGVELKRHGENLLGRCPFHADKTPSLVVTPKKNLWHCLGACQTGGSAVDWVMKAEGVSFRHAVELLRSGAAGGSGFPSNTSRVNPAAAPAKQSTVRRLPPPVEASAEDGELLGQVVDYYHQELKKSPEALEYLRKRGLDSPELVERFRLGFANRTLGLRLPLANRKTGAELRGRLQRLGVLRESGHEHFNGSLVVPILGDGGEVLGLYGRKVTSNLRPGTPLHLYLPGPHRGVFNVEALGPGEPVILCEALLDALTFWRAGFRSVTTSYGVEGFTERHLEAFRRRGVKAVLIAYDRDEAGESAAQKLAVRLMGEGLECWRVQFPKGMDANEYALKVQPAPKSLGVALRQAVWMGSGKAARPAPEPSSLAAAGGVGAVAKAEIFRGPELAQARPTRALEPAHAQPSAPPRTPVAIAAQPAPAPQPPPSAPAAADVGPPRSPPPPEPSPPTLPQRPVGPQTAAVVTQEEVVVTLGESGERRYRVRGLGSNSTLELLKVNLLASFGERFHVDTFDLYSAKCRAVFLRQAQAELGLSEETLKADLGRVLLKLEELQSERLKQALSPKSKTPALSDEEKARAMELLTSPRLLERVLEDLEKCGVVGEETNKLLGYLAAVSRKLEEPLAVLIQSSSAAGKTSLMDAVLALVPPEDKVAYSAMTGQALFYMGELELSHKVLAIAEEEGATRAAYALKLLQSEGELCIASTGKDPQTGRLVTQEYRVEGPVQLFLTTTAIELDEELLNRCVVLTVDEGQEQTRAIHHKQRQKQTLAGLVARTEKEGLLKLHQDAQRLLRSLPVVNPHAPGLTFLDDRPRTRRDFQKYLGLISAVALLHQHQRPTKTVEVKGTVVEYVEASLEDVAVANRLAHQVLGRSLDEMSPQTRGLLLKLDAWAESRCTAQGVGRRDFRFTRREAREATGLSETQARVHLEKLVALEYVVAHRGRNGQQFVYELVYDGKGKDGRPFLIGLADVSELTAKNHPAGKQYDADLAASEDHLAAPQPHLAGSLRAARGGVAAPSRRPAPAETASGPLSLAAVTLATPENPRPGSRGSAAPSYVQGAAPAVAARG